MHTPRRPNTFAQPLLLAAILAAILGTSHYLDDAQQASTQNAVQDALHSQAQQTRFAQAAAKACGPESTWADAGDNAITCYAHRSQ